MLDELIIRERQEIIARAKAKAEARSGPISRDAELEAGIPLFLDVLLETLRILSPPTGAVRSYAAQYGGGSLRTGCSVSQVVHGYGDVCQSVTEVALEKGTPITTDEFRLFNGCLDESIASAVTEYERQRDDEFSRHGAQRLGVLAHELRNALSTALLAFGSLSRGLVGAKSSTAALLNRSLLRMRDLVDRSLSEVRLDSGVVHLQQVSVRSVIQDVAAAGSMEAAERGVALEIPPCRSPFDVEADRQLLMGALQNLVQNALKFTVPGGHVCVTVRESGAGVLIDVEDECGGLRHDKMDQLFQAFEQQGADRTGLGLGLWISQASITSMGGKLSVRNMPQKGCVFTVALRTWRPAPTDRTSRRPAEDGLSDAVIAPAS